MLHIVENDEDFNIYFANNTKCFTLICDQDIRNKLTEHINKINPSLQYDNDIADIEELQKEIEIALSK